MNRFVRKASTAAALALAYLPFVAFVTPAHAEGVRVRVGDLSQSAGVAAFEVRLDRASSAICAHDPRDLGAAAREGTCRTAVRAEAVAALSPAQRAQLGSVAVASN